MALAIHISEKLRDNAIVMVQAQNNSREQAVNANLRQVDRRCERLQQRSERGNERDELLCGDDLDAVVMLGL